MPATPQLSIDWCDPKQKISDYFSVGEALYLPRWERLANEQDGLSDESKTALALLFQKMDKVRELLCVPIIVHVSYRPLAYNTLIGGAIDSSHIARLIGSYYVAACDFHPLLDYATQGEKCDAGKRMLTSQLDTLGLRMENNQKGSSWIHLDTHPVVDSRFFNP